MKRSVWILGLALLGLFFSIQATHSSPFHSSLLTIETAIARTLKQNRALHISASNVQSQRYALFSANSIFDVKLAPVLSAGMNGSSGSTGQGSYGAGLQFSKKLNFGADIAVTPSINRQSHTTSEGVTISLQQPLMRGAGQFVVMNGVLSSEFAMRSTIRSDYRARVTAILQTVSLFYQTVTLAQVLEDDRQIAKKLQRHAMAAQAKEKVGFASNIDVLRAQLELNNVQNAIEQVQEQHQNALDQLKVQLALPLTQQLKLIDAFDLPSIDLSEKHAIDTALQQRIDFEQNRDELHESQRSVRLSKDNLLPDLSLSAGYTMDRPLHGGVVNKQWSLKLGSTTDFARTQEKAAYQQALIRDENAQINATLLRDRVISETRAALRSMVKAKQNIKLRELQILQAEGKLQLAKIKFDHNKADNFDVISAERELINARISLIQAKRSYLIGVYKLKATIGILLPKPKTLAQGIND